MPTEAVLLILLIAWTSCGALLALVMGRRGHSPAGWGILGALLGPLALPVALDAARRRRPLAVKILAPGGQVRAGVAVLAGIDGSQEAHLALSRAVSLLGPRLGRLALVTVVPYDAAADPVVLDSEEAAARLWMGPARQLVPGIDAEEYVVAGRPADVLAELAESDGFDVIVVGARGRGMSPRLLGSVAESLVNSSPMPVLVGGRTDAAPAPRLRVV